MLQPARLVLASPPAHCPPPHLAGDAVIGAQVQGGDEGVAVLHEPTLACSRGGGMDRGLAAAAVKKGCFPRMEEEGWASDSGIRADMAGLISSSSSLACLARLPRR